MSNAPKGPGVGINFRKAPSLLEGGTHGDHKKLLKIQKILRDDRGIGAHKSSCERERKVPKKKGHEMRDLERQETERLRGWNREKLGRRGLHSESGHE